MKLTQLLEHLQYEVIQGNDDIMVTELVNDSRRVCEGSVFVCISGAVSDGHSYIADVAEKKAAAVIVEKDVKLPEGLTVIKVSDTRYALALMSAAYFGYPADRLKVIGITGTKGKTTTTYMVKSILEGVGHKVGLIGTIEVLIGDKSIPANNTTPESYTIQKYFAEMVKLAATVLLWKFRLRGLCFTERREYHLRSAYLPISVRITSDRMNIRILKIISIVRACFSSSADLALPMWMTDGLKMCLRGQPVRWRLSGFQKKQGCGRRISAISQNRDIWE